MPGSDTRRQMGFYFHHALNAVRAFEAGDSEMKQVLAKIKSFIDDGGFPVDDPGKFAAWLGSVEEAVSKHQAAWYNRQQSLHPDKWQDGYEHANGLLNPINAALLGNYLETRNPDCWEALKARMLVDPLR